MHPIPITIGEMNLYAFYTPSHKKLVNEWFLPSIDKKEYKLILKKEKQIGSGEYGNSAFNSSMIYKVDEILKAIESNWGKIFVYADIDIQFLSKTKKILLKKIKGKDIVFQCNGKSGEVCAGFFVCRANQRTLQFWKDVRKVAIKNSIHDQDAANILLIGKPETDNYLARITNSIIRRVNQTAVNYKFLNNFTYPYLTLLKNKYSIRWGYLPDKFYCPGLTRRVKWEPGDALSIPKDTVLHHANWTVGIENKILQFGYVKNIRLIKKPLRSSNIYTYLRKLKYCLIPPVVRVERSGDKKHPKGSRVPYQFNFKKTTKLCNIMLAAGSDKGLGSHKYTTFYSALFSKRVTKIKRVFEMGVGTTNIKIPSNMGNQGIPGASLRGWRSYFPNAEIFGADIDRGCLFQENRISTFYCDQTKPKSIRQMWVPGQGLNRKFDLIVDDGFHNFSANVCFFESSIHKLNNHGVYVVEDVETKSLPDWNELIAKKYLKRYPKLAFYIVSLPHPTNNFNNNLIVIEKV